MTIAQIHDENFRDAVIDMDSKRFFGCIFTNCTLRYAGGQCEWDKNTTFSGCAWQFIDGAIRTKQVLDLIQMSNSGSPAFSLKDRDFFTH